MRVLFPIDEAYPLYKIGGLGDVGGSLPKALSSHDCDIRLALPRHPQIKTQDFRQIDTFPIHYHNQQLDVNVLSGHLPDTQIPTYLFQENTYISQQTDASDNHADKFAVFSLAVAKWLTLTSSFSPQIIHLHDWHTALIPVILTHLFPSKKLKSLVTIHNLAYQGNTDTPVAQKLHLPPDSCQILNWDQSDSFTNILLEGILHADYFTTVSPNYSKEILTPEYGQGVETILQTKASKLVGILNGLDYQTFNPQTDPHLFQNFDQHSFAQGKAANKQQLLQALNLSSDPNQPLIGFVGRVDPQQKGVQLIIDAINQKLIPLPHTHFIFLGTGDPELEKQLHQASANQPNIHIATRYDEQLAARIYAASDLVLIPSKFEPCGLVQMIAMRYGALPIARKTGGLADTIDHGQTGFLFDDYSTQAMVSATQQALQAIADPDAKNKLNHQAMNVDFTWDKPAQEYLQLYRQILLE